MVNGLNLNRYKKWLWPINAILFNLTRLIPCRDNALWLFGSNAGTYYSDNSKYLFEYVNIRDKGIKCVWVTRSSDVLGDLKKQGYTVARTNSIKGIWYSLRCGAAIYTHGMSDFGYFPLVGGAKIVALWHGVGFKQIYNTSYTGLLKVMKHLTDAVFSWTYRDISMATSEYTKNQFYSRFVIKENSIYITGQPRNDVLRKPDNETKVYEELGIDSEKKVILYMPTYRNPRQGNVLNTIVLELINSVSLCRFLATHNYVFVVKLHPASTLPPINVSKYFKIVDYKGIKNNQELLSLADILITDYSSCFVDYSLLNRPVIFYVPDESDYLRYSGQMDMEFFEIYKLCKASNPDELVKIMKTPQSEVAVVTNELFEDKSIKNSCYSENVYNAILDSLRNENKNSLY